MKLILSLFLSLPAFICAEIVSIQLEWNPKFCKENYTKDLTELFEKMPGCEEITLDTKTGKASLHWKSDVPFSFSAINLGMRRIGPRLRTLQIKVSGKVKHHHHNVALLSTGDGSRFQLYDTPEARHTKDVRSLTQKQLTRFIQAEEKGEIVVVEGQIFPPNHLIIDEMQFIESKEKKCKKRH